MPVAGVWPRTLNRACNYGKCRDRNVLNSHIEKSPIKQENCMFLKTRNMPNDGKRETFKPL